DGEARVARNRQLDHLEANLCPGVVLEIAMGRLPGGNEQHLVELKLEERLLRAHQVSDVRGVEGAPEDPYAQGADDLLPDLARALDDELVRGELAHADRAAS